MQSLTNTLNVYFPLLILISTFLALIYQIYQTKQVRVQLKVVEDRCSEHESTIKTLRSEEINTLKDQLHQTEIERDQAKARYVTLEQEHDSQLQNYEQLQTEINRVTAERDKLQTERDSFLVAKRSKPKRTKNRRNYSVLVPQYLIDNPGSSMSAVAKALGCSPSAINFHYYSVLVPQYLIDNPGSSMGAVAKALGCLPKTVKPHWPSEPELTEQTVAIDAIDAIAAIGAD